MRIATGKVVGGHVIVEGEPLLEGAAVTVLVADEPTFTLSAEDKAVLIQSIAQADRGELLNANDILDQLP